MSVRILIRRLIGRQGVFFIRNLLATISTSFGIVNAEKEDKENGITAMVCSFNEEEWIELSLLSIKDIVDEYLVIDSSTDKTPQILERLREKGLPIRLYRMPPGDLVKARNFALQKAKYKWILMWDADFVATEKLVKTIKTLVESLDKRYYYLIYWPFIRFCGDIYHVCVPPLHIEHWLYTWSGKLKYVWIDKFESLIAPLHMYKVIYISEPLGYHFCYVRRPDRLYFKQIWWRYRKTIDELLRTNPEKAIKFARQIALREYGTADLYEAGLRLIKELTKRMERYDERKYGPLPQNIVEYYYKKILQRQDIPKLA